MGQALIEKSKDPEKGMIRKLSVTCQLTDSSEYQWW
jgi:hypothetical protein